MNRTTLKAATGALLALSLVACGNEVSVTMPSVQVSGTLSGVSSEAMATSIASSFLEAQGAMGTFMGPMTMGTGAGTGLMLGAPGFPMPDATTMMTMFSPGMSTTRTVVYYDGKGNVQPKYDSLTTAKVVSDEKVSLSSTTTVGTRTRSVTLDGSHHTETSGLEGRETQITINGSGSTKSVADAKGGDYPTEHNETTTSESMTNLVVPVPRERGKYPKSGTTTHERKTVLTSTSATETKTVTRSYKEVVTYDGSSTAKVVLTIDGTTKNCTRSLENGRLTCP